MRLLHVPEVQSIPPSLGTQGCPAACFARQQDGLMMLPAKGNMKHFILASLIFPLKYFLPPRQYSVDAHPVLVPVHDVHMVRSARE